MNIGEWSNNDIAATLAAVFCIALVVAAVMDEWQRRKQPKPHIRPASRKAAGDGIKFGL